MTRKRTYSEPSRGIPSKPVFHDSAFDDDAAKTNFAAILEQRGCENVRSW